MVNRFARSQPKAVETSKTCPYSLTVLNEANRLAMGRDYQIITSALNVFNYDCGKYKEDLDEIIPRLLPGHP